jgi:hypothetical protein
MKVVAYFFCLLVLIFENNCCSFKFNKWKQQRLFLNIFQLKDTKKSAQPEGGADISTFSLHQVPEMILFSKSDLDDLVQSRNSISQERDKLLSERADLLIRLAELTNQSVQYLASMAKKNTEIEELRRENAELRERIASLETLVCELQGEAKGTAVFMESLKFKVSQLQADAKVAASQAKVTQESLKFEVSQLQADAKVAASEAKVTQESLSKLYVKMEYETFISALQDSNSYYQLENFGTVMPSMKQLRKFRNGHAHYILEDDIPELMNYKISILIAKIQTSMTVACRYRFQNRFGAKFLDNVVQLLSWKLVNSNISISSIDTMDKIAVEDFWWYT